jgi:SpoVK/Ycf46/Vps4 family AAA+-type ATPase
MWLTPEQRRVVDETRFWLENRLWYFERDVPWKRGFLLHGPPGNGKSSFVFSLARYFDLPVNIIRLETMDNQDLVDAWKPGHGGVINLIEDIDAVFEGRRNVKETPHYPMVSFDCLLNVMDGVEQNQGVLTFVTTNKPEVLDEALGKFTECREAGVLSVSSRPGRLDNAVWFGPPDEEGRRFITERVTGPLTDEEWRRHEEELLRVSSAPSGAVVKEIARLKALEKLWAGKGEERCL